MPQAVYIDGASGARSHWLPDAAPVPSLAGPLPRVAGALQNSPSTAYITKYNRFVDTILERVNKILRRSYDPVNVRLTPGEKAAVKSADKEKKKKNKKKNKNNQRDGDMMSKTDDA